MGSRLQERWQPSLAGAVEIAGKNPTPSAGNVISNESGGQTCVVDRRDRRGRLVLTRGGHYCTEGVEALRVGRVLRRAR